MSSSTPGERCRASSLSLDRFDGDGKLVEQDGQIDEESLIEQLGLPSEK